MRKLSTHADDFGGGVGLLSAEPRTSWRRRGRNNCSTVWLVSFFGGYLTPAGFQRCQAARGPVKPHTQSLQVQGSSQNN